MPFLIVFAGAYVAYRRKQQLAQELIEQEQAEDAAASEHGSGPMTWEPASVQSVLAYKHWTLLDLLPSEREIAYLENPICTATFFEGSYLHAQQHLQRRVEEIVVKNPWLGGYLVRVPTQQTQQPVAPSSSSSSLLTGRGGGGGASDDGNNVPPSFRSSGDNHPGELYVLFDPSGKERCPGYFQVYEPNDIGVGRSTPYAILGEILAVERAVVRRNRRLVNRRDRPLWKVAIIPDVDAPDERFCLVLSMSHGLADAHTYYNIFAMLDAAVHNSHNDDNGSVESGIVTALNPIRPSDYAKNLERMLSPEEHMYLRRATLTRRMPLHNASVMSPNASPASKRTSAAVVAAIVAAEMKELLLEDNDEDQEEVEDAAAIVAKEIQDLLANENDDEQKEETATEMKPAAAATSALMGVGEEEDDRFKAPLEEESHSQKDDTSSPPALKTSAPQTDNHSTLPTTQNSTSSTPDDKGDANVGHDIVNKSDSNANANGEDIADSEETANQFDATLNSPNAQMQSMLDQADESSRVMCSLFYVSEGWIAEQKKRSQFLDTATVVSTNSILTSWFFNALQPSLALMTVNTRQRVPGVSVTNAGNFVHAIPYSPQDYATPQLIQESVRTLRRVEPPPASRRMSYIEGLPPTLTEDTSVCISNSWTQACPKHAISLLPTPAAAAVEVSLNSQEEPTTTTSSRSGNGRHSMQQTLHIPVHRFDAALAGQFPAPLSFMQTFVAQPRTNSGNDGDSNDRELAKPRMGVLLICTESAWKASVLNCGIVDEMIDQV